MDIEEKSYKIVMAERFEHLKFNLYNFNVFRKSKGGKAIPFFGRSGTMTLLIALPYIVGSELIFLRGKRFFVKLKEQIVALFVLQEEQDALYVSSLGVLPEFREHGIATHILDYCIEIASRQGKKWLELTVLKMNRPARRLYERTGFIKKKEERWSFVLRKRVLHPAYRLRVKR